MLRGEMLSTPLLPSSLWPSLLVWRLFHGLKTAANPPGICIPLFYIRSRSFASKKPVFSLPFVHRGSFAPVSRRYTWRKKQSRWVGINPGLNKV
ncbi:unnamed protein product [Bubo scandiacus]